MQVSPKLEFLGLDLREVCQCYRSSIVIRITVWSSSNSRTHYMVL